MKKILITILLITTTLITNAQSTIKTYIDQNLSNQGNKGITGTKLKNVLNATVDWVDSSKFSTTKKIFTNRNIETVYTKILTANTNTTPYILNKPYEEIEVSFSGSFWYAIDTVNAPISVKFYTTTGTPGDFTGRPTGTFLIRYRETAMPGRTTLPNIVSNETSIASSNVIARDYMVFHLQLLSKTPYKYKTDLILNPRSLADNFMPLRELNSTIANSIPSQSVSLTSIPASAANILVAPEVGANPNTITITALSPWINYRLISSLTSGTHTIILPSTPLGWSSNTVYIAPAMATTITTPANQTFKGSVQIKRISDTTNLIVVFP